MSVDNATVARIAHLARIGIAEAELAPLSDELNQILQWVEQLDEVETDAVPPMASVNDEKLRWRADTVNDGGVADKVVANAPQATGHFFTVPKVVE
jgi:aspartyl-tRNA(Asn)/glutamyl-tRNA(Gln) amidotransferase subunit C